METVIIPLIWTISAPAIPMNTPINPPIIDNKKDSIKNCILMSDGFAPIAIRIPISFVLSVTDTNIIFIMPIPPTSKDTDAIEANKIANV